MEFGFNNYFDLEFLILSELRYCRFNKNIAFHHKFFIFIKLKYKILFKKNKDYSIQIDLY